MFSLGSTRTLSIPIWTLAVVLGCVALAAGQVEEDIDQYIESVMVSSEIPGLSLALVRDGQSFMVKGYGVKRLNTTDLVTNDTLFYIASTTKAFTATLLSNILYNHSSYSLDSRVRDIMSDFYLAEDHRQETTTPRDLLAHRVGVWESLYNWLLGEVTTREDIVSRARFFAATEPFRSDTLCYSNLFYTTAGLLIQILSAGRTWEDVMRDDIFTPLGMRDTSFMDQLTEEQGTRLATPYEPDWRNDNHLREVSLEFFKNTGPGGPSGSIVSSSKDLVNWLEMLTNEGVSLAGEQVVESEVLGSTWTPHMVSGQQQGDEPITKTVENYGLGWYTGHYGGYQMVTHSGYMYGYQSMATVYPTQKLAIFTCINGQTSDGQSLIHNYISDTLLNLTTINTFKKPPTPSLLNNYRHLSNTIKNTMEMNIEALSEYIGTYGNFAFGNVTVVMDDVTGRLRGLYGNLVDVDMLYAGNDRFLGSAEEPLWFFPPLPMIFARNDLDVVETVTIPIFLPQDPPVFVRDRTMDEAPPPSDGSSCSRAKFIFA